MSSVTQLPDRIADKISVDSTTGCWLWTGSTLNGYGRVRWMGNARYSHRVVFELLVAPIPVGLDVDHLCRRPACCRPDHLEPVEHRTNVLRGIEAMSTCRNGLHPWVDGNIMTQRSGYRTCRPCRLDSYARRNAKRAATRELVAS
jgi:hypothetical protein